jgi:hypothetical protein
MDRKLTTNGGFGPLRAKKQQMKRLLILSGGRNLYFLIHAGELLESFRGIEQVRKP